MSRPTVAVIGASRDRRKYGNKSVRAHHQQGYDVFPINPQATEIEGLTAYPTLAAAPVERFDRITIYVPPDIGEQLLDDIAAKSQGGTEVWFNPGSESEELLEQAHARGLNVIVACSIVDVGMSPGQLSNH